MVGAAGLFSMHSFHRTEQGATVAIPLQSYHGHPAKSLGVPALRFASAGMTRAISARTDKNLSPSIRYPIT
jgi:hypothetical protein